MASRAKFNLNHKTSDGDEWWPQPQSNGGIGLSIKLTTRLFNLAYSACTMAWCGAKFNTPCNADCRCRLLCDSNYNIPGSCKASSPRNQTPDKDYI